MKKGTVILLGVTGGIAAYKAAQLCSDLAKAGASVHVLMSANATRFVAPLTFETLSGNKVSVDTFDRLFQWNVEHVALAKQAQLFVVAPATANFIAKAANGLADDMLTTTFLASSCPKLVAPAMNTGMLDNPATQRNIRTLEEMGVGIIQPESGHLACGDAGRGRLASLPVILEAAERALTHRDLEGKRVVITAGPTQEAIDPVRYITNHSTGRMGYQTALAALRRGAQVTLITGKTSLEPPMGAEVVKVTSAAQMFQAVKDALPQADIIIKTAAVADYRPVEAADHKIKKKEGELSIPLARTDDILAWLGQNRRGGQVVIGFSMETNDLIENSTQKLQKKNAHMIVANSLTQEGAGFGGETNVACFITQDGVERLPKMSKYELGDRILTRALAFLD